MSLKDKKGEGDKNTVGTCKRLRLSLLGMTRAGAGRMSVGSGGHVKIVSPP